MTHLAQVVVTLQLWTIIPWSVSFFRDFKVDEIIRPKSCQNLTNGDWDSGELSSNKPIALLCELLSWSSIRSRVGLEGNLLSGLDITTRVDNTYSGLLGFIGGLIEMGFLSNNSCAGSFPDVIALSILHPAATISEKLVAV